MRPALSGTWLVFEAPAEPAWRVDHPWVIGLTHASMTDNNESTLTLSLPCSLQTLVDWSMVASELTSPEPDLAEVKVDRYEFPQGPPFDVKSLDCLTAGSLRIQQGNATIGFPIGRTREETPFSESPAALTQPVASNRLSVDSSGRFAPSSTPKRLRTRCWRAA